MLEDLKIALNWKLKIDANAKMAIKLNDAGNHFPSEMIPQKLVNDTRELYSNLSVWVIENVL